MTDIKLTQRLEQAKEPQRKRFIRLLISEEDQALSDLDNLSYEISRSISSQAIGVDMDRLNPVLKSLFAAWAVKYAVDISRNNVTAAQLSVGQEVEHVTTFFGRGFESTRTLAQGEQYIDTLRGTGFVRRRSVFDGITVGQRIKTIENGSLKTVQNIINDGMKRGVSAPQMAKEIQNYLVNDVEKKWVSPYQYYRDVFGYRLPKRPSDIRAGSMKSNVIRIARTEINETWRSATINATSGQEWVKGYKWNLSASHPKLDICDDWADGSPYTERDVSGLGHPHCMCYVTTVL